MTVIILSRVNGHIRREEIPVETETRGGDGVHLTRRELEKLAYRLVWSVARYIEGKTVSVQISFDPPP